MNKRLFLAAFLCVVLVRPLRSAEEPAPDPQKLYAVIEIGASGIKGVALQVLPADPGAETPPVKALKQFEPQDKNAFSADAANGAQISEAVSKMHKQMSADLHVPDDHIYIVGSSGIPPEVRNAVKDIAFEEGSIEFITADKEATLAFKGVVPPRRYKQVVMLDIGSGNSKGAYLDGGPPNAPVFNTFAIPYGTKTFAAEVNKKRGDAAFLATANQLRETLLAPALAEAVSHSPGMRTRKRLYLAGGATWAMATLLHPDQVGPDAQGKEGVFIKLTAQDVTGFCGMTIMDPAAVFKADLSGVRPENQQKTAEEVARVAKVFTPEQLLSGTMVLKVFMDQMNLEKKEGIFFSKRALYAWPQGYLLEKLAAKG